MIETAATDLLVQSIVPLEVTQTEAFQYIQSDALLSASLWVNIALAGLSILLFVYMGRNVEDPRAQLIFVATLMVPLVSISSYTGLVSGLTVGFLEMPAGHALAGVGTGPDGTVFTPRGPVPHVGAVDADDPHRARPARRIERDEAVHGRRGRHRNVHHGPRGRADDVLPTLRWVWYVISCAFFAVVLYILLAEWAEDAEIAGTAEIFNTLKILTVVLWLGYPIVWGLGAEGLAVIQSPAVTSWAYSGFDIIAKYLFAFLLLRWVASNEGRSPTWRPASARSPAAARRRPTTEGAVTFAPLRIPLRPVSTAASRRRHG